MRAIVAGISLFYSIQLMANPMLLLQRDELTLNGFLMVDAGYTYVDNISGESETDFTSGMMSPNLIGLSGSYNTGKEIDIIFNLENQFSLEDGRTVGDDLFSRQSWIGLKTPYGSITGGKQYEFMFESLSEKRWGQKLSAVSLHQMQQGPYQSFGFPSIDFNRTSGAFRVESAVKYVSPVYNGMSAGIMYGDESSGAKTLSTGLNYANENLRINMAYTKSDGFLGSPSEVENYGIGFAMDVGNHTYDAIYTKTHNELNDAEVDVFGVGMHSMLGGNYSIYTNLQYMDGNASIGNRDAMQIGSTLMYKYSPNIDFYGTVVYQDTSGDGTTHANITAVPGSSSDESQLLTRIGVRFILF